MKITAGNSSLHLYNHPNGKFNTILFALFKPKNSYRRITRFYEKVTMFMKKM